jgi:phosphate:Na+ symporter
MGENIGTTATANLAALGSGKEARRAALAHLLFNVFGVVWVLCVFYPFVDVVCYIMGYDPSVAGQGERLPVVLAMFHTCFNVTNTALLIGFIPQMERVVCWLMPDSKEPQREQLQLEYIEGGLMQTPEIAVLQAQKETARFGERVGRMFGMVRQLFDERQDKQFVSMYAEIAHQEDLTDQTELAIAHYLEQVSEGHLSDDTKLKVRQMMRTVGELESVGDACYNLARTMNRLQEKGLELLPRQRERLKDLMSLCDEALRQMNIVISGRREEHDTRETFRIENEINQMRQRLKEESLQAAGGHEYDYALGAAFTDLINECEKLGDYVVNAVQARFGR